MIKFTAKEIARYALVMPADVDRWLRLRLFRTRMGIEELHGALLYRELAERGFSRLAFERFWREVLVRRPGITEPRWHFLLTNGQQVILLEHQDTVLAFLTQRREKGWVLIPLDPIREKIAAAEKRLMEKLGPGSEGSDPAIARIA